MNEYNIYIKLTNGCNLCCKHCYNEIMGNHNTMSEDTIDEVINWLKELRKNNLSKELNISLHGGEPMLYDLDKINYLLNETKELNLKWCVTTNLVYNITDKHINIFKKMIPFDKPMIMTSYDFGDLRFKLSQEEQWKNNVKVIQDNNIEIQPIICVTDFVVKNISKERFFKFINDNHFNRFNLERITETGRALKNKIKPDNNLQDKWLFEIYKEYIKRKDLFCPLFKSIELATQGILGGCRERKCMKNVITVNPNGNISACPNMADRVYGNLSNINEKEHQKLINFENTYDTKCLMCEYFKYCNGDCCQLSWDKTGCPGMKSILNYILKK